MSATTVFFVDPSVVQCRIIGTALLHDEQAGIDDMHYMFGVLDLEVGRAAAIDVGAQRRSMALRQGHGQERRATTLRVFGGGPDNERRRPVDLTSTLVH